MTSQRLIQIIANALSLPDLAFSDEGVCSVFIPGELELQLEWDEESGQLVLLASVGHLGTDEDGALSRELLSANFLFSGTRGETLSLEPDTGKIFLCAARSFEPDSETAVINWLAGFVDTAQHWRIRLLNRDRAPSPSAGESVNLVRG